VTFLPDVNVLVAIAWPNHVHHSAARKWFADGHGVGWATCPATEAGFVRVSSNRRVIPDARSIREAVGVLRGLRAVGGHRFWPDDVSVAACPEVGIDDLQGYRQVTDAMLLALAARNQGVLVTFDGGVAALAQANAIEVLLLEL
jgi:uncharacterized protein